MLDPTTLRKDPPMSLIRTLAALAAASAQPRSSRRWGRVLGLIAGLVLAVALVTPAHAASAGIAVSADPTEEKPVTLTVSGVADASTRLYVFQHAGTAACPATASGLSYTYELSGTSDGYADGDAIAAGAYTRSYQFTPGAAGSYRVCAYLAASTGATPQAVNSQTVTARAPNASVGIATSSDPTEEETVSYTVTGTTEVDRRLYVYVQAASGTACPSAPNGISYTYELSGTSDGYADGDVVAAGSFSRSYSFVPSDSGAWRVCAYVGETAGAQPSAVDARSTSVREPTADLAFAVSADPTEERTVSITASGATEVGRRVYVYAQPGSAACPSSAGGVSYTYELSGTSAGYADGDTVAAGSFSRTYEFTPAGDGAYRLCGYVAESYGDAPNARAVGQFTARNPTIQLDASISPGEYQDGQAMSVTVTATSELDRRLFVFVLPDTSACPATASDSGEEGERTGTSSYYADGDPLAAGQPATRSYSFTASSTHANYRVCAYVGETSRDSEKVATAVAVRRDALAGVLVTNNEEEERDHVFLVWRRGSGKDRDHVYIYNRDPGLGPKPVWSGRLDDSDLRVTSDGENHRVLLRRHLGYGRFWWRVARTDASGHRVLSEARTVRIVPRPLTASAAKARTKLRLRKSSRRPGTASVVITSSPLAKVRLLVRRAGRTVARRTFTEGVSGARTFKLALSCGRTGRFSYTVNITDPYGTKATRKGAWVVSAARCARLKAAEEAKAEARRRATPTPDHNAGGGGGGGGGGGCDGDPGATPFPQFPGQRDGDGDGCYGES